jgi:hypothetical protein
MARVHIGQIIMSICTKLKNEEYMSLSLRPYIGSSSSFLFTRRSTFQRSGFLVDEFETMVAEKWLALHLCEVK